ncbi:fasciclin domain-containing protein [Armatimonas rosea]|uniref:Putative surface protein with fasciclin (FAS1) repeats n=1 Tax=Armatimonas rosea TaxID=685828 RepID=A0A7W9SQW7_ARMRO|nr:fasciclin domain-containing protein [Armatimonas rosea]MBB6050800.1 putative surface protein with fasciclin (FAS1) repeats [Armatimonas rosea]
MKYKERGLRLSVALVIVTLVSSQIPMRGQVALGSAGSFYPASQPADGYLSGATDSSGGFLGFNGITNRNVISGVALGLLGLGLYESIRTPHPKAPPSGAAQALTKPIYDVLKDLPADFSEIVKLIDSAELVSTLRAEGAYTFFAPSDVALRALSEAAQNQLRDPASKATLVQLLKKHIVVGRFTISALRALPDGTALETLSGETLTLRNTEGILQIDGVAIVQTDIFASNGWIHPIEKFMER